MADATRIAAMPKAELHRHLEGCVRVGTIIDLARRSGRKLPTFDEAELSRKAKLSAPMGGLAEVLGMFELARGAFSSYEAIERITCEALEDAAKKENIKLLELRYSPDFMAGDTGLDWEKSLGVILSAVSAAVKGRGPLCGVIVIASRSFGMRSVEKTAGFALKHRKKIIGFDLADDETNYPSRSYEGVARSLREAGLPLTVHSGEEGRWTQVEDTLKYLSPARIGHGVKAAEDPTGRTLELIKARGVTIECNPWSNYLTRAVPSVEEHPLPKFLSAGIRACIGADDPEILDTHLNKEYALALDRMGLTFEDLKLANRNAAEGSFLPPDMRQEALKLLEL